MITTLALLVLSTASTTPTPPYRRLETVSITGMQCWASAGSTVLIGSWGYCEAYDVRTFKRLWRTPMPINVELAAEFDVADGQVLVGAEMIDKRKPGHLVALDLKTGKVRWTLPRPAESSKIVHDGQHWYTSLKTDTLSAIDRRTHRIKWSITLGKAGEGIDAATVIPGRLFVNYDNRSIALDPATGKRLWEDDKSYMRGVPFVVGKGIVWVPYENGSIARDLKTGRRLWKNDKLGYSDFGAFVGGNFIGLDDKALTAINPNTGKKAWSIPTGSIYYGGEDPHGWVNGENVFINGTETAIICRADGKVLWKGKSVAAISLPCWTDGKQLVSMYDERLTRYVTGTPEPVANDSASRRAMAEKMVAQFDKLDQADKARLTSLGDDAFPALLKGFLSACAAHDNVPKGRDSYPLYSKFHDLGDELKEVTKKKRTPDLLNALRTAKLESSAKPQLMTLLAKFGEPNDVVPLFLQELEGFKTPGFEMYESNTYIARTYIINSKHPDAVRFMVNQLANPDADATLRQEAYWHVAGTAGSEGVKAVLAERHKRELLRPLAERMTLDKASEDPKSRAMTKILAQSKKDGRQWGLLQCGALGSRGDLWIGEKVDGKWTDPVFLGISVDGPSRWSKTETPAPKLGGKTAKELIAGAWIDFVNSPLVRDDRDKDGLTDLAEKRLGTDPTKADTDGDGDRDDIDPFPTAAPRELSEAEKVVEAVYEARYHFDGNEAPGLLFAPADEKPCEFAGRRDPVMWITQKGEKRDWGTDLEKCYEQGVTFIAFSGPSQREETKTWDKTIQWNANRTEARLLISTYYGGLNSTGYSAIVRKFGNDWVVVEMHMEFIS